MKEEKKDNAYWTRLAEERERRLFPGRHYKKRVRNFLLFILGVIASALFGG